MIAAILLTILLALATAGAVLVKLVGRALDDARRLDDNETDDDWL